jgi:prevent-host-death family protein
MQREATAMTVRQNLGELLNEVQYKHDEVVITKAGKPVAVLIDLELYKGLKRDSDDFDRLWAKFSTPFEGMTEDQVMDEVTALVKDVRKNRRLEALRQRPVAQ